MLASDSWRKAYGSMPALVGREPLRHRLPSSSAGRVCAPTVPSRPSSQRPRAESCCPPQPVSASAGHLVPLGSSRFVPSFNLAVVKRNFLLGSKRNFLFGRDTVSFTVFRCFLVLI